MAGRQEGASTGQGRCSPKYRWGRAYAEGRLGNPAADPHAAGSPASVAWIAGDANKADPTFQYETAVA